MKTRTPHLFALITIAAVSCVSAQTVGYWRFETSPGFVSDSSGNGLTLTNSGAGQAPNTPPRAFSDPISQTGEANKHFAFTLGGTATTPPNRKQQLELSAASLDRVFSRGDFTIEAMVSFGTEAINGLNADIATQWGDGQQAFRFLKDARNGLSMGLANANATAFFSPPSFTFESNKHYYVAAAVDFGNGTTSVTFHIQNLTDGGTLQTIAGRTFETPPDNMGASTADFIIGGSDAFNPNSIGARIDEVRLSNGILASGE